MPVVCEVRALGPHDATHYKALRDATLAAHPTSFTSDGTEEAARSADSYHARLGPPGATSTLGAYIEGRLVGAVTCERDPRRKVLHVGHLTGMMVAEAAQGAGVGRALLADCIAAARRDGLTLLTLTVTAGNDRAGHLYRSFGFSHCGTLPRAIQIDGQYYAKEQMALLL